MTSVSGGSQRRSLAATAWLGRRSALLSGLLAGLFLTLLAGCGPAHVVVQGNFPPPLIEPLPLTIGVWYSDAFSKHEFFDDAKSRTQSSWIVSTGVAQVQMWDALLAGMFAHVVHLQGQPTPGQAIAGVDAVLIPHVEELQYAIPAQTQVKVYEIWMRYRFELQSAEGSPIAEWTMTGYGKTPTALLQSDQEAVNLAAVIALRAAGANFATNFTHLPAIQAWLQEKGVQTVAVTP